MSSNSLEFSRFVDAAETMENESGKLAKIEHASDLLGIAGADVGIAARFIQGDIFPAWDNRKVSVGSVLVYKALAEASGLTRDEIESRVADVGDPGLVCEQLDIESDSGQVTLGERDGLTVSRVYEVFCELATTEGSGSQQRKIDLINTLLFDASGREAKFIVRLLLGKMRIGVGGGTVRRAISEAFGVDESTVKRGVMVTNDVEVVAMAARDGGSEAVSELSVELGRPIKPMLAQKTSKSEALSDAGVDGEVLVEWKYDGARIQLHHRPGDDRTQPDGDRAEPTTRVFSRNMEDVTDALPEVVEFADDHLDRPVILDGEVVAIDDDGAPLPFQEVLKRFRRKHDVAKAREAVAVRPVFFDCLHADGDDLLDAPLTTRHDRLERVLAAGSDQEPDAVSGLSLLWCTGDPDEIESIDADALAAGHEGIMLTNPDSTYSPGRRGKHWRKRKPDVETLDCVVTGAEWGEGRRATYLGTFELSVRDGDGFETIGKVATGITDAKLAELTELLEPHITAEDGQDVDLDPAIVFEVGYEEIQTSPTYSAGYALRFPRFLGVRHDKEPADAESIDRLERLRSQ